MKFEEVRLGESFITDTGFPAIRVEDQRRDNASWSNVQIQTEPPSFCWLNSQDEVTLNKDRIIPVGTKFKEFTQTVTILGYRWWNNHVIYDIEIESALDVEFFTRTLPKVRKGVRVDISPQWVADMRHYEKHPDDSFASRKGLIAKQEYNLSKHIYGKGEKIVGELKYVFHKTGGLEIFDLSGQKRYEIGITGETRAKILPPVIPQEKFVYVPPTSEVLAAQEANRKANREAVIPLADIAVDELIAENPLALQDYRSGNKKALNGLMGDMRKKYPAINGGVLKDRLELKLKSLN